MRGVGPAAFPVLQHSIAGYYPNIPHAKRPCRLWASFLPPYSQQNRKNFQPYLMPLGGLQARKWELTNTRYLLGTCCHLEVLNAYFDPVHHG
jgi:hypothetical protein